MKNVSMASGTATATYGKNLQREILVSIRGHRSQEWLNRKMSLKPKQVHRWETARSAISWSDFVELCDCVKAPLEQAFRQVPGYVGDIRSAPDLLKFFVGHLSHAKLAQRLRVSKSVVQRWYRGQTSPSMLQVLEIITSISRYSLSSFLFVFVPQNGPLLPGSKSQQSKQNLIFEMPWLPAIISFLDHEDYRNMKTHKEGYFADKLKIPLSMEKKSLKALTDNGIIAFEKGHYFNIPEFKSSSTSGNILSSGQLRKYWTNRALALVEKKTSANPLFWPFTISSIDEETLLKIKEKLVICFNEISQMALDSPKENIAVVIAMQCIDITALPKESPKQNSHENPTDESL